MNEITREYRCVCGKLLFRGMILSGAIEVKCRSCKRIETVQSFSGSAIDSTGYVLVLDAQGQLLRWSASAPVILGYSADELLQKRVSELIVMLSPEFFISLWEALRSNGPTIFLLQSLQRHRDQSMSPVEIEAQYLESTVEAVIFSVRKKSVPHLTHVLHAVV